MQHENGSFTYYAFFYYRLFEEKEKNGRDQKQCASQVFILNLLMPTVGLQLTQNDIPSSFKILCRYYKERKKKK